MEEKVYEQFLIEPDDNMLRNYAHLNVDWLDMLFEAGNNAIQEAENNNLDLNLTFDFQFNSDDLLTKISIRDNSGGIAKANIARCLTPGKKPPKTTLNEHGQGLNFTIEVLTRSENSSFELNSCHPEGSFQINQLPSFIRPVSIIDSLPRPDDTCGVELNFMGFENVETIKYPRYQTRGAAISNFWKMACAKYRYKKKEFENRGNKFEITITETHPEKETRIKTFGDLGPVIVNPSNGKKGEWVSVFNLSEIDEAGNEYEIRVKLGVASLDVDDYNTDVGDLSLSNSTHPYKKGNDDVAGFDVFYQGVMIKRGDLHIIPFITATGLSGGNRITYGDMRGELHIIKGGKSFFTKNGMVPDPVLDKLYQQAANILKGKMPAPSPGAPKINYIKKYVERRSADAKYAPEKIVKYRHRQLDKDLGAGTEFMQETHNVAGIMDMFKKDELIVEHKIDKTTIRDVNQLLSYMIYHPSVPKGQLYAPEHSDESVDYVAHLNDMLKSKNQEIELKVTSFALLNPSLSEDEKSL